MVVPLLACVYLAWSDAWRVRRVGYVTGVVSGEAAVSARSPSGYDGGVRNLIVPQQNADSFDWIAQTQQSLAQGEWRVRRIAYEDAPDGREIYTPSPYRWWLSLIASIDHGLSNRPLGISVERAALLTDPVSHFILLLSAVGLVAWRFGAWPASVLSVAIVITFPFAAGFFPGAPDDKTLSRACSLLAVLLLISGFKSISPSQSPPGLRRVGRWFFAAGIVSAFGLWISVADQVPMILGIALGGFLAAMTVRRQSGDSPVHASDWLNWSLGGASASLVFYLIEYAPNFLGSWRLHAIHPLYSVGWLGLGGILSVATSWARRDVRPARLRMAFVVLASTLAIVAVPVVMWKMKDAGFLAPDLWSLRLSRIPGSAEAASLWAWLIHDGFSATVRAALLPAFLIVPAAWCWWRPGAAATTRVAIALAVGPVLLVLGFACWQIGRWSSFDAVVLAMLVPVTAAFCETSGRRTGWIWAATIGLILLPGALRLRPPSGAADKVPLNDAELGGLISRDLAHWLAKRTATEQPIVLAPPDETMALQYYGGLRGIGSVAWGNEPGIGAAVRIFGATTPQEASARVQRRAVTHIVLPSWNRYLDEYFRVGSVNVENAFLSGLRNWAPIPWLKPVPYQLPAVSGYEGQMVAVFEVVDEQNEAAVLSAQADYFVEMGQLDYAEAISQSLQRFRADLGAWVTRAEVAVARQDGSTLTEALKFITPKVAAGAERTLRWDQRVTLALVLAQGQQTDLARDQVRRCLAEVDEKRLRTLSTSSLYRLLVLAKAFGVEITDTRLRGLALDLLPSEWRNRL